MACCAPPCTHAGCVAVRSTWRCHAFPPAPCHRTRMTTLATAETWTGALAARLRTGFGAGQGAAVDRGDPARLLAVRPGGGHEDRLPVVAELLDALPDVGERPVAAVLGGRVVVRP